MNDKMSMRARINGLEVGQTLSFPLPEYNYESICVTCRRLRVTTGKVYSYELNPIESKQRMLTVTRTE